MGQGNNSIFYKNFIKAEKAVEAVVFNSASELAGEFTLLVVAYPSESLEETEKLIRKTIADFETEVLMTEKINDLLVPLKFSIIRSIG